MDGHVKSIPLAIAYHDGFLLTLSVLNCPFFVILLFHFLLLVQLYEQKELEWWKNKNIVMQITPSHWTFPVNAYHAFSQSWGCLCVCVCVAKILFATSSPILYTDIIASCAPALFMPLLFYYPCKFNLNTQAPYLLNVHRYKYLLMCSYFSQVTLEKILYPLPK